jgi:hypothetical protein
MNRPRKSEEMNMDNMTSRIVTLLWAATETGKQMSEAEIIERATILYGVDISTDQGREELMARFFDDPAFIIKGKISVAINPRIRLNIIRYLAKKL